MAYRRLHPRITLDDGTELSVQASSSHYCSPKDDVGPYVSLEVLIEVGKPCPSWGNHQPYGWVSIRKLECLIARRGGIAFGDPWWRNQWTEV